ncbi:MAG: phenylalanine--tRNA ligase subunit beta [Myxococcales bacterium]|nr:phenylalanine--tRNA ligase subunit beta [Myxococcales bacterium]
MKISLRWLRELCPVTLSDDEIAKRLTFAGLEIEARESRSIGAGVVAARVVTRTPIQGSDHLSVCQVDDGAGTHQIVCGAQNYAAGDVVPMARVGAKLPNGMEIRKAKLRGVESAGMLCSPRELGLSEDHAGLMMLPKDAKIGAPLDELLGLPDTIFEVNVTPNRPDALSHLGIARELSALTGVTVKTPQAQPAPDTKIPAHVHDEAPDRCPRYVARVIEDVKIGPSPLAVQERLRSCGVRPISNVVDATNLALLELGHPLHAFDLAKLAGQKIIVRRANEGEKLTTLDGKERALSADDLVIADPEKAVALAGVMGGQTSEVSEKTTRILLESAMFEASGIRRTARRHGLHTEASHRFERGMDEKTADLAANRCAELIVQLAGGRLLPGAIDRYPSPLPQARVWVRPSRVAAILGTEVTPKEVERILSALQLEPLDGNPERRLWGVPSWRRDLTREIDCVEEVARLRGYDTIPIEIHKAGVGETAGITPQERVKAAGRSALIAAGFDEVVNYSFIAEKDLAPFLASGMAPIRVANPLTVEQGVMRASLMPGLLRNLSHNLTRGVRDLRLYELGRIYLGIRDPSHPEGELAWPVFEPDYLGLAMTGQRAPKSWTGGGEPIDFYDLKGAAEDILAAMGVDDVRFAHTDAAPFHPASASELLVKGKRAGVLGQVHPLVAAQFDVPAETFLAEINWQSLVENATALRTFRGVPKFPAVARDLAFVVDASVPAEKLLNEISAVDSAKLIEQVTLFDVYRGAPVPEGRKSVAFGLALRAADRTLTDAEADSLCNAIRERLKSALGAEIRSG